ncbi:MAG: sulfite exporter TauE/SafE family protein [archaeon GB-1845-036]|nr:sulfite exporter TauE/SafE family protein [Candidatus Culexmicrobium thermophilum]
MVTNNIIITTAVISIITGVLSAMLGIGGGAIIVPTFSMILGLPIQITIGTSKFIMLFTSASSAIGHFRYKRIDWKTGVLLEVATIPGSILGAQLITVIDPHILKMIVGLVLTAAGFNMIKGRKERAKSKNVEKESGWRRTILTKDGKVYSYTLTIKQLIVALIMSFIAGLIAGISGLGGGIVKVPVLNLILNIPIHVATSTSAFMILLTTPPTAIVHIINNQVNWIISLIAAPGLIIGAQVGARIVGDIKPKNLRRIFAIALITLSLKMIYDGYMAYMAQMNI